MKRDQAALLLQHILRRLDQGQSEWPASLVTEVHVFGSFARGALEPRDVDLDVEFDVDRRWAEHFATCLAYGRDPHGPMKRALAGGRRGCQFQFNFRDRAHFGMTLLWRKGGTLGDSLARLAAIQLDPGAGRAPREAMLPQFEGLDDYIPLRLRQALCAAAAAGAISIDRCLLSDGVPASVAARHELAARWLPSSPLYRAGSAVVASWERRNINLAHTDLHRGGWMDDGRSPRYFAGFGWRYVTAIPECLSGRGAAEWLEIVRPTRTRPLDALRLRPRQRRYLRQIQWH